ncbi:hypothetical protein ACHAXA_009149, partial [Cyclostephanos tholiformis]
RGEVPALSVALKVWGDEGPAASLTTGEFHVINTQSEVRGRARSKVRVRVVGVHSLGWVDMLEGWGAEIEAVVVSSLDHYKNIRLLVTATPTMAFDRGYDLPPRGPWDRCLATNVLTSEDARVMAALFKRWRLALGILSIPGTLSRSETLSLLPCDLPSFYQKKIITARHSGIGGVTSSVWRFVFYSRWSDAIPPPSIMMGQAIPRTLQMALSDVVGACIWDGEQPPEAIGIVLSSGTQNSSPLFDGDGIVPDLHALPFKEVHFWVRAFSVYSKDPVIRRVKTVGLFAIWDYEGKLESQQWSRIKQLGILQACVACPPAKMLRRFIQYMCNACLTRMSSRSHTVGIDSSVPMAGLTRDIPFSLMEVKSSTLMMRKWIYQHGPSPKKRLNRQRPKMSFGVLLSDGGVAILLKKRWHGGERMARTSRIWRRFKIASSELEPAPTGSGLGAVDCSFGGSCKNSMKKCVTGYLSITSPLPHGDMRIIRHPLQGRQRLSAEKRYFNFGFEVS